MLEWDSFIKEFGSCEELAEEKAFAGMLFKERMRYSKPDVIVDVFQSKDDRIAAAKIFNGRLNAAVMQCSLETCIKRNSKRSCPPLDNAELASIVHSFQPVEKDEGFRKIYIINGETSQC